MNLGQNEVHDIDLLDDVLACIIKYVIFPSIHEELAVALWICTTRTVSVSSHSPVLLIESPVPGCGKTTLLNVLRILCPNAIIASEVTPAGLARYLKANPQATILIDEADSAMNFGGLATVINCGFERGGGVRLVTNMETLASETQNLFGPKAIARIAGGSGLSSATMSRTIQVCLN